MFPLWEQSLTRGLIAMQEALVPGLNEIISVNHPAARAVIEQVSIRLLSKMIF